VEETLWRRSLEEEVRIPRKWWKEWNHRYIAGILMLVGWDE